MIEHKRMDNSDLQSEKMFGHKSVLEFLKINKKYVKADQVIKILILERKFRLSLQYIKMSQTPFHIEFFTNAIEANAFDIAFYLFKMYEEQVF
jgi:hypothetical protein